MMNSQTAPLENTNPHTGKIYGIPADALRYILAPVPLFVLQPILRRIVEKIARERPELFNRIGPHKDKLFLIDPTNLPFAFVLKAHPEKPLFRAYRRKDLPETDARIAGTFLTLFDMVDGEIDGDAMFFSRALTVEGDTEAIVCLRNALDDMDGSVTEDTANMFGAAGRRMLKTIRKAHQNAKPQ